MDAAALLEDIIALGAKIDNLWSMAIGVHLAIFWMVLVIQRPLLIAERLVVFTALAIFELVNGNALAESYRLMTAVQADLGAALADLDGRFETASVIAGMDYTQRALWVAGTHGGALVVVGLIIAFQSHIYRHHMKAAARQADAIAGTEVSGRP